MNTVLHHRRCEEAVSPLGSAAMVLMIASGIRGRTALKRLRKSRHGRAAPVGAERLLSRNVCVLRRSDRLPLNTPAVQANHTAVCTDRVRALRKQQHLLLHRRGCPRGQPGRSTISFEQCRTPLGPRNRPAALIQSATKACHGGR